MPKSKDNKQEMATCTRPLLYEQQSPMSWNRGTIWYDTEYSNVGYATGFFQIVKDSNGEEVESQFTNAISLIKHILW